ncbi:uncharacterized protein N0V89_003342 [Didymosphaeria variabile]|uniref:Uncharacterized protein n=1 Tax=Didymosphaeria variabile TaxID=1932322 RepID=A0A9W8XVY0_9PLEO|nr:uncharacterized protein N0V89_003342 [Didymosphaeria variabile]KAJ4358758.1 hypothetical protein N0V89_003342 [Didymosphaeria variabile]
MPSLLELIQKEPEFHVSTAKEYDATLRDGEVPPTIACSHEGRRPGKYDESRHFPAYSTDSQQRIIEILPRPWDILGSVALDEMAKLMPESQRIKDFYAAVDEDVESPKRYCYSGTACAIQLLKELRSEHRLNLRKIVIDERYLSVCAMESHANGLIPYCNENPKLCIEVKVDVWHVLLQKTWYDGRLFAYSVIVGVARWLSEASSLLAQGMPQGQYTLLLGGAEPELLEPLWNAIKRAAAIYEGTQNIEEVHLDLFSRFPTDFHVLVRQSFDGGLPLRFDAPLGEPWDPTQVMHELEHLIPDAIDWHNMIDLSALERHAHILDAIRKEYYTVS